MRKVILAILNIINRLWSKGRTVIFNSFPDLEGSALALYRYIVNERCDICQKYDLVWCVGTGGVDDAITALRETDPSGRFRVVKKLSVKGILTYFRACGIITTHNYITGLYTAKGQTHYHLAHGMPLIKGVGKAIQNKNIKDVFQGDVTLANSRFFKENVSALLDMPYDRIFVTGLPSDDDVLCPDNALNKLGINKHNYTKTVLWCPTYRRSDVGTLRDDGDMSAFGVSDVLGKYRSETEEILKKENILLLIKFHPMDVLRNKDFPETENIRIINEDQLKAKGISFNQLMGDCDAFWTDYSSAYITFILTGRPCAFIIGDIEAYRKKRGFGVDDPIRYMPGEIISDHESLMRYIENMEETDIKHKAKYEEIRKLFHKYTDGRASERVCRLIFDGDRSYG